MPQPVAAAETTDDTLKVERSGHFEQVPHELFVHERNGIPNPYAVPPRAVVLYLALSKSGPNATIPGRRRLARETGQSVRTNDVAADDLIRAGWLLVTPRLRAYGMGQTSNAWTLLWEPLKAWTDARLVKHQRAVEAFDDAMAELQMRSGKTGVRSRRAATWRGPVATNDAITFAPEQILHPGDAESRTGSAQISTPLEEHPTQEQPTDQYTSEVGSLPSRPAARADTAEAWVAEADAWLVRDGEPAGSINTLLEALAERDDIGDPRAWLAAALANKVTREAVGAFVLSLWRSDVLAWDDEQDRNLFRRVWASASDRLAGSSQLLALEPGFSVSDVWYYLEANGADWPGLYLRRIARDGDGGLIRVANAFHSERQITFEARAAELPSGDDPWSVSAIPA